MGHFQCTGPGIECATVTDASYTVHWLSWVIESSQGGGWEHSVELRWVVLGRNPVACFQALSQAAKKQVDKLTLIFTYIYQVQCVAVLTQTDVNWRSSVAFP